MWLPHGFHTDTMQFLCTLHGCHVDIMWFPCAHHVVSRWTPFGFQVDTMWFPGGQHRVSKVDTMWFLQDTTGFPHGCHVVSIWTPCVVEVTTWKPAQKTALHEANWLPCCWSVWSTLHFKNFLNENFENYIFSILLTLWISLIDTL